MQTSQTQVSLTKPQRKLLNELLACVRADRFTVPVEVSVEIDQEEVQVAKNLAQKGLLVISESDERQARITAAALNF